MINLNEAVLAKAKKAKSVEELLALAKESGVEITAEQAQEIFAQLNQKSGELADDELDNVAGGGCYSGEGYLVVTAGYYCNLWKCNKCGSTELKMTNFGEKILCINGDSLQRCADCSYCISQAGLVLCSNPGNKQ
jgi:hypothetical protein